MRMGVSYDYGLIYPMFAMVTLTFVVFVALFRNRAQSVSQGVISAAYFSGWAVLLLMWTYLVIHITMSN